MSAAFDGVAQEGKSVIQGMKPFGDIGCDSISRRDCCRSGSRDVTSFFNLESRSSFHFLTSETRGRTIRDSGGVFQKFISSQSLREFVDQRDLPADPQ